MQTQLKKSICLICLIETSKELSFTEFLCNIPLNNDKTIPALICCSNDKDENLINKQESLLLSFENGNTLMKMKLSQDRVILCHKIKDYFGATIIEVAPSRAGVIV